jgi:hypothetical protein
MHQKVEVTEHTFPNGSGTYVELVFGEPTISALQKAAESEGLFLKIRGTGGIGLSMDCPHPNRLNVNIEKAPDGSHYRIAGLCIG